MQQNFCLEFGDTCFIGIVDVNTYHSFVDENWEFDVLCARFVEEMQKGDIIVVCMTKEGVEYSWRIAVEIGTPFREQLCYRSAEGYIQVTDGALYLADYDSLTMAAQYENEKLPNEYCAKDKIVIDNGIYKVRIQQFYDCDANLRTGGDETDLLLHFEKADHFAQPLKDIVWNIYE